MLLCSDTLSWFHLNNSPQVDMLLCSDTLSWFQANQFLILLLNACVLYGQTTNTNFIVFGLTLIIRSYISVPNVSTIDVSMLLPLKIEMSEKEIKYRYWDLWLTYNSHHLKDVTLSHASEELLDAYHIAIKLKLNVCCIFFNFHFCWYPNN